MASSSIWQCAFIWRGDIDELVALADLWKRSLWVWRAWTTRSRMISDFSPVAAFDDSSRKSTSGTSQWMSIRSNNGPEIRWR